MAGRPVPQSDVLHIHLDPEVALAPYARHRHRFAEEVADLDRGRAVRSSPGAASGASPTCCATSTTSTVGWMPSGAAVLPRSRLSTPMSRRTSGCKPVEECLTLEVRDRFVTATSARASTISGHAVERWGVPSVSPLGAVPWWMSALHIFFDSWVHERDALLPLGIEPPVLDDEAGPVATYVVGVAATFASGPLTTVIAGVRVHIDDSPPEVAPASGSQYSRERDRRCHRCAVRPWFPRLPSLRGHDAAAVEQFGTLARLLKQLRCPGYFFFGGNDDAYAEPSFTHFSS